MGVVGVPVVMAVVGGPPQHPFLTRCLREEGECELGWPAQTISAMAEVAVVSRRDAKHPHEIAACEPPPRRGCPWQCEGRQREQVEERKARHRTAFLPGGPSSRRRLRV